VLEKNERWFFTGDPQPLIGRVTATLAQYGLFLQQVGPNGWGARAQGASWGLVPKANVAVLPAQGGFFVDLRLSADFETNGIIIFVLLWVFFFPAAIVVGLLAYQDLSNRQTTLVQAVWAGLGSLPGAAAPGPLQAPGVNPAPPRAG
jgi:hypothetical protein